MKKAALFLERCFFNAHFAGQAILIQPKSQSSKESLRQCDFIDAATLSAPIES